MVDNGGEGVAYIYIYEQMCTYIYTHIRRCSKANQHSYARTPHCIGCKSWSMDRECFMLDLEDGDVPIFCPLLCVCIQTLCFYS